jgi:hypothetical protein
MNTNKIVTALMATGALAYAAKAAWDVIPVPALIAREYKCEPWCACQCNRKGCGCHGGQ